MATKRWQKNSLVVGLILLSAGWFVWMTETGIVVKSKADDSKVELLKKDVEGAKQLVDQKLGDLCTHMDEVKTALKNHEEKQEKQISEITNLLIQMSRENKARR